MGNNPSVRRFKDDMLDLQKTMRQSFHDTLLLQADELVGNIQRAIPHSVSGDLSRSIRKKDVSTDTKDSVLVLGGGPLTTKRTKAGAFDYAIAEEFGTTKEEARPFFYSTVRQYRSGIGAAYQETFAEAIEENNILRQARADNLVMPGQTQSHRGAYLLPTKRR